MAETLQKETDVTVIYLDPLNRGDYDKDSYLEGMTRNIELLEQAFGGQEE
jgi:zinc transport system substrate-binding protein